MYNYANDIKNRVAVRDVCERYGIAVSPTGFTACPFHREKTPSCKVDYRGGGYHCFGCGAHGDVIDFVGGLFDIGFRDAEKKINDDFGLGLPIGQKLSTDEETRLNAILTQNKRRREAQAREREKLFTEYLTALERWIWLDKMKRENKPTDPEHIDYLYSYACGRIEQAKYDVQSAEARLYCFEKERKQDEITACTRVYSG